MSRLLALALINSYLQRRFWTAFTVQLVFFCVVLPRDLSFSLFRSFGQDSWPFSFAVLVPLQLAKGVVGLEDLNARMKGFIYTLPLRPIDFITASYIQQLIYSIPLLLLCLGLGFVLQEGRALVVVLTLSLGLDLLISLVPLPASSHRRFQEVPTGIFTFYCGIVVDLVKRTGTRIFICIGLAVVIDSILLLALVSSRPNSQWAFIHYLQGFISTFVLGLLNPEVRSLIRERVPWLRSLPGHRTLELKIHGAVYLLALVPSFLILLINGSIWSLASFAVNGALAIGISALSGRYFIVVHCGLLFAQLKFLGELT